MANIPDELQEEFGKLQQAEQHLKQFGEQKQETQSRLVEIESALDELDESDTAFKIIGNVMVEQSADELREDLKEQEAELNKQFESLEQQESQMREQAEQLQQDIMERMQ